MTISRTETVHAWAAIWSTRTFISQDAGWNAVDAGAQDCGAGRGHVSGVHFQVQEVRQAGQTRAKAQGAEQCAGWGQCPQAVLCKSN